MEMQITTNHFVALYESRPAMAFLVEIDGPSVFQFGPFDGETALSLVEVLFPRLQLIHLPIQSGKLDDDAALILASAQLMAASETPS